MLEEAKAKKEECPSPLTPVLSACFLKDLCVVNLQSQLDHLALNAGILAFKKWKL